MTNEASIRPETRTPGDAWWRVLLPLALFTPVLIAGMCWAFPDYDDARGEYLLAAYGPPGLSNSQADRPVQGKVWEWLAERNVLWPTAIAVDAFGWFVIGVCTVWLYRRVIPNQPRAALAAGLIAIAPILVELHFVILNGVVYVHALDALALVCFVREARTWRSWFASTLLGGILLCLSLMIYEFGLSAAGAMIGLIALRKAGNRSSFERRRDLLTVAALIASCAAGYLTYRALASPTFNRGTGLSFLLAEGATRFVKFPFRMLSALWTIVIGAVAREAAVVNIDAYEGLFGALFGIGLGVVVWLLFRHLPVDSEKPETVSGGSQLGTSANSGFWRRHSAVIRLLTAIFLGLTPVFLMGRRPNDVDVSSRFFIPILPVAAVLCAHLLMSITAPRFRMGLLVGVAFVAGFATLSKALSERSENQMLKRWAAEIRPHLDPEGVTLVMLPPVSPPLFRNMISDEEIGARLGRYWPLEVRKRFWGTADLRVLGPSASSAMRGVSFSAPKKVLLVMPRAATRDVDIVDLPLSELERLPKPEVDPAALGN